MAGGFPRCAGLAVHKTTVGAGVLAREGRATGRTVQTFETTPPIGSPCSRGLPHTGCRTWRWSPRRVTGSPCSIAGE
jgi:hypothetical protein